MLEEINRVPGHITVCVCTYKRAPWLEVLLKRLVLQETQDLFRYSVVVADNDDRQAGWPVVERMSANSAFPIKYVVERERSISRVRNLAIANASGDAIAFIDDDELPELDWLLQLFNALVTYRAAGVLGPVEPRYEAGAPRWVQASGLYKRPRHPSGFEMPWRECRTGNVLFHRSILTGLDPAFRLEFSTGGSDVDFFRRVTDAGARFVWCDEAVVHEYVPAQRWKRTVLLRRALLRGCNSYRQRQGRGQALAKAAIALPLYLVALPFLQLAGHHWFMRYLVKACDHSGRLLAACGLQPVRKRDM